jgi:hypothetical protein
MTQFRVMCGLAVVVALLCAGPGTGTAQMLPSPAGPQVIVYELTENLKVFRNHPIPPRRLATASLGGFAIEGSPLCPVGFGTPFDPAIPDQRFCNVNIFGSDNISTRTLLGSLHGDFTVTVEGENPLDGPEAVVMRGTFNGSVDFTPVLTGRFIGLVEGTMVPQGGGGPVPFKGVFRLPTLCPALGYHLTDQNGNPDPPPCEPVAPTEMLFGRAMVRLDVWFE